MLCLADVPSSWLSVEVLGTLAIVVAASWIVFGLLAARYTSQRQATALVDWGRDHGFRVMDCEEGPPEPFAHIEERVLRTPICLAGKAGMLLQLVEAPDLTLSRPRATGRPWNLLVRKIGSAWAPTGLRPVHATHSILDLFALTSFPLLGPTDRFVIYGTDSAAARALSRSAARGLLPQDIGLLLAGGYLVLDFSQRPFDDIEFNRMMVVAEQLIKHLPVTA